MTATCEGLVAICQPKRLWSMGAKCVELAPPHDAWFAPVGLCPLNVFTAIGKLPPPVLLRVYYCITYYRPATNIITATCEGLVVICRPKRLWSMGANCAPPHDAWFAPVGLYPINVFTAIGKLPPPVLLRVYHCITYYRSATSIITATCEGLLPTKASVVHGC